MKKTSRLQVLAILVLSFYSCAFASSNSIDPMRIGVGARSLAMGRTSAASAGDINSIFINPANAAYIDNYGITSMYTSLLEGDINYTLLGGAGKVLGGGAGLAYLGGVSGGIQSTTLDANSRVSATGNSFDYSNSTIALVYGREIRPNLSAGGSLKLFNKNFSGLSSGAGFDADLGMLYRAGDALNLGLALQNILPEGMGGLSWGSGTREDTAMNIKGGIKYNLRENILFNADFDLMPFAIHSGVEWWLTPIFALRAGLEQMPTGSSTQVTNLGAGAGIRLNGLNFDYAYLNDGSLAANSTHFFTLSYVPSIPKPKTIVKEPTGEAAVKAESLSDKYKKKLLMQSGGEVPMILAPKPLSIKKNIKLLAKPKPKPKPLHKIKPGKKFIKKKR